MKMNDRHLVHADDRVPADQDSVTRVLVFPCGTEIGLELCRAMGQCRNVELVGASSVSSNHGPFVYKRYIDGLPTVDDPRFIAQIANLVRRESIDLLFPAHDSVVVKLSEHADSLDCEVVTSPMKTCQICRSKGATYNTLERIVNVPHVYTRDEPKSFPVFLKPDVGQGSKGTHLVQTQHELDFYLSVDPTLLVLEYLPGDEFTVDCFTDRHGVLAFSGARQRVRTYSGISVDTHPVVESVLDEMAVKINNCMTFRGMWFFQAKRNTDGDFVLLEVAPRLAGSMALYRILGVNFAMLSLFDRLGMDVKVSANAIGIEMDRALTNRFNLDIDFQNVYIDLDDTLLMAGEVNTLWVAFIFQCRNKGIAVHLLTRHAGNLDQILAETRLAGLFDSITHLGATELKSGFMTEPHAIFIDDSFSERNEVHCALGIPVFAPDAIEGLLDWRR